MLRKTWMIAGLLSLVGFVATAQAHPGCPGCKEVKEGGQGFCCGKGMVFGEETGSKQLATAMAGEKADVSKMKCPGCKKAAEDNGACTHCNVFVADGKVYHNQVAYSLAMGKTITEDCVKGMKCDGCKKAAESDGFCCGKGAVAGRMYDSKELYDAALAAHNTLVKALKAAEKCEACAVAMVTDGECEHCKVKFKGGEKV